MNDLLKEIGKLIYDFAKITFAVAIITPLVKKEEYSLYAIFAVVFLVFLGTFIIYRGSKQ